jgi:hypothetical protein
VVLERDGEISWTDQERNEEVLLRQGGEEFSKNNEKKECYLDWSHLA